MDKVRHGLQDGRHTKVDVVVVVVVDPRGCKALVIEL